MSSARAAAALAAGVAVASCLGSEPAPPIERPAARAVRIRNGDYACSIESGGHQYPAFRCAMYRAEDGSQVLEKVGGSQRFRGRVMTEEVGFSFDGTFFCPDGDCTESVTGRFTPVGSARYRGTMQGRSGPLSVSLRYLPGGFTYAAVSPGLQMEGPPAQ